MSVLSAPLAGSAIIAQAETWLGVPYLYGGGRGSPAQARLNGVDCSGFVYQVFTALGIDPGTDTVSQFNNPNAVDVPSLAQAQPGDLIFFGSPVGGTQEHVGIYLGGGTMIDAPHTGATVRLDRVAGFENLLGIRRLTGALPAAAGVATDPGSQPQPSLDSTTLDSSSSSPGASLGRLFAEIVAVALALALVAAGVIQASKPKPQAAPT